MHSPSTDSCIALTTALPPFVIACICLRLYAEVRRRRSGLDDYLAVFAFLVYLASSIILLIGAVKYGFGQHIYASVAEGYNDDLSTLTTATKHLDFVVELMIPWGIGSAKVSILLFYRRIFRGRAFNITTWTMIFYCIIWVLVNFCMGLLQCGSNVSWLWSSEHKIAAGSCLPGTPLGYMNATSDFVPDLIILLIPIYWASKVNMALGRKLFVCLVFFVAILAVAASLARMIIFIHVYRVHNIDPDQLAFLTNKTFSEVLELGISVIAISLPKLPLLLSDQQRDLIAQKLQLLVPSSLYYTRRAGSRNVPFQPTGSKAKTAVTISETHIASAESSTTGNGDYDVDCYALESRQLPEERDRDDRILVTRETTLKVTPALDSF